MLIVLGAAVLMALVLGLLLRNALRGRSSAGDAQGAAATAAELETLKTANAELGRKLAVEEFKASRLVEVEAALTDVSGRLEALREGKAGTDGELAAARQEAAGLREVEADLRERLANAGTAVGTAEADTVAMREAKSAVDEVLSARMAALAAAEVGLLDLKQRLETAEGRSREQEDRFAKLRDEKAAVDESLSAKVEALRNSEEKTGELRAQLAGVTDELSGVQETVVQLRTANATIRETLDQERKQADEKIALLMAARVEMSKEFKALAEEIMARHGESFTKLNKEQMDGILTPLKEKLGEFERNVQASHVESVKERATLAEQIRHIAETGANMGSPHDLYKTAR